jgi:hypothetical protein
MMLEIRASESGYLEFHALDPDMFLGLSRVAREAIYEAARWVTPKARLEIESVTVSESEREPR